MKHQEFIANGSVTFRFTGGERRTDADINIFREVFSDRLYCHIPLTSKTEKCKGVDCEGWVTADQDIEFGTCYKALDSRLEKVKQQ